MLMKIMCDQNLKKNNNKLTFKDLMGELCQMNWTDNHDN